jgi:uncharacterized repeat protein (TIGR03843 family)
MPAPERLPAGGLNPGPATAPQPPEDVVELLATGELTVHGRLTAASNAVLYCTVARDGREVACVYKPVAGERPLWDFPDGTLAHREVAAYLVSEATGWGLVPPTVLRDGPFGEGMCQLWITTPGDAADEADADDRAADAGARAAADEPADAAAEPYAADPADPADDGAGPEPLLALVEGDEPGPGWKAVGFAEVGEGRTALLVHADDPRLRRLAVLDAVINNADRKGGHLLRTADGGLFAIDHGVTFNTEDKLRTLLWGWAGEPLPEDVPPVLRELAAGLDGALGERLAELLTAAELAALRARVAGLLESGRHPVPSGEWPAIPWPPV